jgi:hypothetical protein
VRFVVGRLDLTNRIAACPFRAVGTAALAGAWYGLARGRPKLPLPRSFGGALIAAVGAVVLRVVRDAVFGEMARMAQQWWQESREQATPGYVSTD